MALELQDVCGMCFWGRNRLTPAQSHVQIPSPSDPQKIICKECRQEWSTVTVGRIDGGRGSRSKWVQIRSRPPGMPPSRDRLCKYIKAGRCRNAQKCTYAHSEVELKAWLQDPPGDQLQPQDGSSLAHSQKKPCSAPNDDFGIRLAPQLSPMIEYRMCKFMSRCFMGKDCTFAHSPEELDAWKKSVIRIRPVHSVHDGGYKLCRYVRAGRRCVYGSFCKFAHSTKELEEWTHELEIDNRTETQNIHFAYLLRGKILSQHQQPDGVQGFEETKNGVTITEVSGHPYPLKWSQSKGNVQWIFQVSAQVAMILQSVILFDPLTMDFTIDGAWILKDQKEIQSRSAHNGECLTKLSFGLSMKILIKISLTPRSGILGQLVVFDFGSVVMVRALEVHVLIEEKATLMENAGAPRVKKPAKIDLCWEQLPVCHNLFHEETDRHLPSYTMPDKMMKPTDITKENYADAIHNLLYLEELQQRKDMSRYDLYDVDIVHKKNYEGPSGVYFAKEGYHFFEVTIDQELFEGGRSIRKGDGALIHPRDSRVLHECCVQQVHRDLVILEVSEQAKQDMYSAKGDDYKCSIRFFLFGIQMQAIHYAVDRVSLDCIFPSPNSPDPRQIPLQISNCFKELEKLELSESQKRAVTSMLHPEYKRIPSLVLGPFGCGKTYSLLKCINLLALHVEDVHILICTHSNTAADIYVEAIHNEWKSRNIAEPPSMIRLYYTGRRINTVSHTVMKYCSIQDGQFKTRLNKIKGKKIIVTTLSTSRVLCLIPEMPKGYFNFIFIDEAAQVTEAESIIPLCLANEHTKIVLAGDHMQMEPPVYSLEARRGGLQTSLLGRLYEHEAYYTEVGQCCKHFLTENHRSCQEILDIPSKLFYENKVVCKAILPSSSTKSIPPIHFIGVDGKESQDVDSPSYYNEYEAMEVAEQIERLMSIGIKPSEVCVVTYYTKQVQRIRNVLRGKKQRLSEVSVIRIDAVLGKEFRAVLVSTVRTCSTQNTFEEMEGFLSDAKLFNTAITRAREWLLIVGEPITLCTVGSNCYCWLEFIRKCMEMGTFQYPLSSDFESFLETRQVVRQIVEKRKKLSVEDRSASITTLGDKMPVHHTSSESDVAPDEAAHAPQQKKTSNPASRLQSRTATNPTLSEIQSDPKLKPFLKKGKPTGIVLGGGSFGSVEEVEIDGKVYAAKRYREDVMVFPEKFCRKFLNEFAILCQLSHPHIVQYHGFCLSTDRNCKLPLFVMEKMAMNLHAFLLREGNLPHSQKICILHDVAGGLFYLHSLKTAVIHRDLTAKNVLLDSSGTVAKIADFGNSRLIDLEPGCSMDSMTAVPGTPVYMAPEAFTDKYDMKVDVFSFGHLALFTIIQEFPYRLDAPNFTDDKGVLRACSEIKRRKTYFTKLYLKVPAENPVAVLIRKSLQNNPASRPSSNELLQQLNKIKSTLTIPEESTTNSTTTNSSSESLHIC